MAEVSSLTKLVGAYRPTKIEPFLLKFLQLADAHASVGEIELDDPTIIKPPREESACWFEHEGNVALTVTVEITSESQTTLQVARLYAAGSKKRGIVLLGPLEHRMVELAAAHGVTYKGRDRRSKERKSEVDPKALKRLEELMLRVREEVAALGPANVERLTKLANELVRRVAALEQATAKPSADAESGDRDAIERLARKIEGRSDDLAALRNQVGRLTEELTRVRGTSVEVSPTPPLDPRLTRLEDRCKERFQDISALQKRSGQLHNETQRVGFELAQLVESFGTLAATVQAHGVELSGLRLELESSLHTLTERIDALVVDRNVAEDELRERVVTLEVRLAEQTEAFQARLEAMEARFHVAEEVATLEDEEGVEPVADEGEDPDRLGHVLFAVYRGADERSIATNRRNWERCLWRRHLLVVPVSQLVRDLKERLRSWNGKPVTEAVAEQLRDYIPERTRRYAKRQAVQTVARCIVEGFEARLGRNWYQRLDDEDAVATFAATLVPLDD